jgi:hypothetical protein
MVTSEGAREPQKNKSRKGAKIMGATVENDRSGSEVRCAGCGQTHIIPDKDIKMDDFGYFILCPILNHTADIELLDKQIIKGV